MNRAPAVSNLDLAETFRHGPVVVAFFKVSCPTCQLAFPFLERLHAAGNTGLQFVGVSQDDDKATAEFAKRYGITFPIRLDRAAHGYEASNAYGITHVPAIFVVEPDGAISDSWSGFSKTEFEKLAQRASVVLFRADESVPVWKAG
jgi:peroxiredoxin